MSIIPRFAPAWSRAAGDFAGLVKAASSRRGQKADSRRQELLSGICRFVHRDRYIFTDL